MDPKLLLALPFAGGLIATLVLTPVAIWVSPRSRISELSDPDRHIHDRPVPRLGGIAVFLALLVGVGVLWYADRHTIWWHEEARLAAGLFAGVSIVFLLGVVDDLIGLPPWFKVVVQIGAALVAYSYGFRVTAVSFSYGSDLPLGWLSLPISVFWMVGVTNAFNLIDGLDGLATGIALVALLAAIGVAPALGNVGMLPVAMALTGALLGFLVYNLSPAKIFLGDSGSLSVGFMLALLTVHSAQQSPGSVLVALPLSALAFPILDTTLAIARRWLRGTPLAKADARHVHHRLLALGHSHRRSVFMLWAAAAGLALFGVVITVAPPAVIAAVAIAGGFVALLLCLYALNQLSYHEFSIARSVLTSGPRIARAMIREQIRAHDLAQAIDRAASKAEIDAILAQASSIFGFARVEFTAESRKLRRQRDTRDGIAVPVCRLEYLIVAPGRRGDEPMVLRIWCGEDYLRRPTTAQRVAGILAVALTQWLAGHPEFRPAAAPRLSSSEARPATPIAHV